MNRLAFVFVLALGLAGCGTMGGIVNSPSNPITKQRLADATETFNASQRIVLKYRALRPCKKSESAWSGCRKYAVYQNLRVLYRGVNKAFDVAERCVRDKSSDVDCIAGLENATRNFYSAALATGVRP